MALYAYQALNKAGKRVNGTLDASSVQAIKDHLIKQGLYPIHIAIAQPDSAKGWDIQAFFARSVSFKEKILFTKQLAVLLRSGVPLLDSFELLIEQSEGKLRTILIDIKDNLKEGQSLAQGLSRHPALFDTIYVQLVRAGEATGKLELILERLTDYLERRQEITRRIKSALMYPAIQLSLISLVVVFLMTVVVPRMADTFRRSGKELPGPTQLLLSLSQFITSYFILIILGIIGLVFAYRAWSKSPQGMLFMSRLKLRLPIVSFFARTGTIVQFARTLGTLIEGGVNLAESLDIVCSIIDNKILATSLQQARDNIIKQGKIAQFLKETGLFPPLAIYLIKTGEESGKLDFMLLTVAQNYETELNEYADGLAATIEPVMMLFMAVVVGFIVIAIALPLLKQAELAAL